MRSISQHPSRRSARKVVLGMTVALVVAAPAAPAQASCFTNAIGVASSGGSTSGTPDACAPAIGQPMGAGTGRKVG